MANARATEPSLTAKQESFARGIALDGLNASDAYRHAYATGDMLPATIWKRASELMDHGAVAGRIAELREAATVAVVSATARTAADVSRVAWQIAEDEEQPASARIAALQLEARRYREYSDKHEHGGPDGGPLQVALLAKLAVMSEDDLRRSLVGDDES